jgi:ribosomal protein S6
MVRFYELTYLASPILEEKELENLAQEIKDFIIKEGGEIKSELSPTKIKLGYPIKDFKEAFLVSLEINYLPERIEALDKKIKEENRILRHLICQKKKRLIKMPELAKKEKIKKPKKVELKELDKKLEELLKE